MLRKLEALKILALYDNGTSQARELGIFVSPIVAVDREFSGVMTI